MLPAPRLTRPFKSDEKNEGLQRAKWSRKRVLLWVTAGLFFIAVLGVLWSLYHSGFEETDDAQVGAYDGVLSAKVPGLVREVLVDENTSVKAGQILVRLDSREYVAAVQKAHGDLISAQADLDQARRDFNRAQRLVRSGAITRQAFDSSNARFLSQQGKLETQDAVLAAANLNLEYAEVRSPMDGRVGRRSVEPGAVVSPGQALFSFVEAKPAWVNANFKETQLKKMKLGQRVKVTVDSIGGHDFEGKVLSFSPGTGSTFAVIPPDNATGNFTKIVQRLLVRIELDPESVRGFEDRLFPGLNVEAKVYVK